MSRLKEKRCHSRAGNTAQVIVQAEPTSSIILSSIVILFYVSLGGLYAVIYTDLFQAGSTVAGLVMWIVILPWANANDFKNFAASLGVRRGWDSLE